MVKELKETKKSRGINVVRNYVKNLCNFLNVDFDKCTIMKTAAEIYLKLIVIVTIGQLETN